MGATIAALGKLREVYKIWAKEAGRGKEVKEWERAPSQVALGDNLKKGRQERLSPRLATMGRKMAAESPREGLRKAEPEQSGKSPGKRRKTKKKGKGGKTKKARRIQKGRKGRAAHEKRKATEEEETTPDKR